MHFEEARLVISIVPPCCSTIPSAMVSPSPGPPVLRLREDLPRWKAAKAATRRGAGIPGPPVVDDCLNTPVLLAHGHARLLAVARRVADDVRERAREDGSPATRNGPPSSRRSVTAPRARRVASVAMGDFLLADAGLRKNRRPTSRGAVAHRP